MANHQRAESKSALKKAGSALAWAFAFKELNPKNLLAPSAHDRGTLLKSSWQDFKRVWFKKPSVHQQETFDQTVERLGISEQQLAVNFRNAVLSSRASYACGFFIMLASGYHAFHGNLFGCIGTLCISTAAFQSGFVRAFLAWRIAERRHAPLKEFVKRIDAWIV